MNTVPHDRCQCVRGAGRRRWRQGRWLAFAFAVTTWATIVFGEEASPAPPAWQRDLDAARIVQTAAALVPAGTAAEDAQRRDRLGQLYGDLAARYPDQPAVQKAAGDFYLGTNQPDLALACWQRAETLDPADAATAETVGAMFLDRGRVREACGQFEHAVAARPDVAVYHFDLANVLYLFRHELLAPPARPDEASALVEALGHFRRAAELAPADRQLAQAYAETFYLLAKPDWVEALAAWKAVLALSGDDTDFANGHLARVSLRMSRTADVGTYLDRIHSPAFDGLKRSLRQKAAVLEASGAAAVAASPSPAGSP